MARTCGFCGRWFKNKQSVRSHLEFCNEYNELKAQGLAGPKPYKRRDTYRCGACGFVAQYDFNLCPSCGVQVG